MIKRSGTSPDPTEGDDGGRGQAPTLRRGIIVVAGFIPALE